jgi:hypothetical protein
MYYFQANFKAIQRLIRELFMIRNMFLVRTCCLSAVISLSLFSNHSLGGNRLTIKNLPNGLYWVKIQRNPHEVRTHHNSKSSTYLAIRKSGNHILAIPYHRGSDADFPYWIRTCIEGNTIVGSGVDIQASTVPTQRGVKISNHNWYQPFKVKMSNGYAYSSIKAPGDTSYFAIVGIHSRAVGEIPKITDYGKLSSLEVPTNCKSIANGTFNKSFISPL